MGKLPPLPHLYVFFQFLALLLGGERYISSSSFTTTDFLYSLATVGVRPMKFSWDVLASFLSNVGADRGGPLTHFDLVDSVRYS